jgi:hypothetical protein
MLTDSYQNFDWNFSRSLEEVMGLMVDIVVVLAAVGYLALVHFPMESDMVIRT